MILLWSRGVVAFWGGTGKTSADLVEGKRREVNGMKNWCYPVTKKKKTEDGSWLRLERPAEAIASVWIGKRRGEVGMGVDGKC